MEALARGQAWRRQQEQVAGGDAEGGKGGQPVVGGGVARLAPLPLMGLPAMVTVGALPLLPGMDVAAAAAGTSLGHGVRPHHASTNIGPLAQRGCGE